ncbi:hypothetical protein BDK51DRAFT_12552, partial [Blyttiomyces helicus]
ARPPPYVPPKWDGVAPISVHAVKGGARAFVMAYGIRGGMAMLLKIVAVLRRRCVWGEGRTIPQVFTSFFSTESRRFASVVGSFTFLWKFTNNLIHHYTGRQSRWNGAVAGTVAGLSILFEEKENRKALASQFCMRGLQAAYNALNVHRELRIPHGDSLLFSIACGSVMYAFIMQPKVRVGVDYAWISKTARIPSRNLAFNRENVRAWEHSPNVPPKIDVTEMLACIDNNKPLAVPAMRARALEYVDAHGGAMPIVPCSVLHPSDTSCIKFSAKLWYRTALGIWPVYAALNFVPLVVLKSGALINNPKTHLARVAHSTLRSTLFLSTFVQTYMNLVCLERAAVDRWGIISRDRRVWYYISGLLCACSIFLENPARRAELAMYVLPKGMMSLWRVSYNRGRMFRIPFFEVYAGAAAMGMLMSVYQTEPHLMSSLLFKVMEKILG